MFSVLAVLMAWQGRNGGGESESQRQNENVVRRPRLATTCPLCTLETRVGADTQPGDEAICIRCDRKFTVGQIYSAVKQRAATAPPRPLKPVSLTAEDRKRPSHCSRCRMGLLPKESRCSYCGLDVADMAMTEQTPDSENVESAERQEGKMSEAEGMRSVSSDLRAGTGRSYRIDLTIAASDQAAAIAIRRDSSVVTVCGQLGSLTLFDSETGRSLASTPKLELPSNSIVHTATFLPDHRLVVGGNRTNGLAIRKRPLLGIWSPTTGKRLQQFEPAYGMICELAVSDDGQIAALGADGWVEVFEPGTASAVHRFRIRASKVLYSNGRQPIARFSAGARYVTSCRGNRACLWEVRSGTLIGEYKTVEYRKLLKRIHRVVQVGVTDSNGRRVLLGGGGVGGFWFRLPARTAHRSAISQVLQADYQPMGTKWRELGELTVWNTAADEIESTLSSEGEVELDAVMDAAFLDDRGHAAALTADGSVVFWAVGNPRPIRREGTPYLFSRLSVAPNGRFVVTQQSANTLRLYRAPWNVKGSGQET